MDSLLNQVKMSEENSLTDFLQNYFSDKGKNLLLTEDFLEMQAKNDEVLSQISDRSEKMQFILLQKLLLDMNDIQKKVDRQIETLDKEIRNYHVFNAILISFLDFAEFMIVNAFLWHIYRDEKRMHPVSIGSTIITLNLGNIVILWGIACCVTIPTYPHSKYREKSKLEGIKSAIERLIPRLNLKLTNWNSFHRHDSTNQTIPTKAEVTRDLQLIARHMETEPGVPVLLPDPGENNIDFLSSLLEVNRSFQNFYGGNRNSSDVIIPINDVD